MNVEVHRDKWDLRTIIQFSDNLFPFYRKRSSASPLTSTARDSNSSKRLKDAPTTWRGASNKSGLHP